MDVKQLDALFSSFTRGCNDEIYNSFTQTVFEFVDRLTLVFPKYEMLLRDARSKLALVVGNCNTKELVHGFMDIVDPLKQQIAERDIEILRKLNEIEFLKGMDFVADWKQCSPKTQNVLWSYLGKLVVVGSKAIKAEQMFAPLQDESFRHKIMNVTLECEAEYSKDGKQVSSMDDIMSLAAKVSEKMKK